MEGRATDAQIAGFLAALRIDVYKRQIEMRVKTKLYGSYLIVILLAAFTGLYGMCAVDEINSCLLYTSHREKKQNIGKFSETFGKNNSEAMKLR